MQSMFSVTPVRAFTDNYIWVLHQDGLAIVVDPGDAAPVTAFLAQKRLQLTGVLITHHHADHIGGLKALKQQWPQTPIYGPATIPDITHAVSDGDTITLPFGVFEVLAVPGHTLDHLAYFHPQALFCGDTLFAAGCGRVFEGTPAQMLASLQKLAELPATTPVYPTHEYTLANLRFALAVEGTTPVLQQRQQLATTLRQQDLPTLPTNIGLELASNPFLRTDQAAIMQSVSTHAGQTITDQLSCFALLREWKNQFH